MKKTYMSLLHLCNVINTLLWSWPPFVLVLTEWKNLQSLCVWLFSYCLYISTFMRFCRKFFFSNSTIIIATIHQIIHTICTVLQSVLLNISVTLGYLSPLYVWLLLPYCTKIILKFLQNFIYTRSCYLRNKASQSKLTKVNKFTYRYIV